MTTALFIGGPWDGQHIEIKGFPPVVKIAQQSGFMSWDDGPTPTTKMEHYEIEYHREILDIPGQNKKYCFYLTGTALLHPPTAIMDALVAGYRVGVLERERHHTHSNEKR